MKRTQRLSLLAVALLLLIPPMAAGRQSEEAIPFETIVKYRDGGPITIHPANVLVAGKRRVWKQAWKLANDRFASIPPLPEVDFDSKMVILVFHDFICSPCNRSITKILKTEKGLQLTVRHTQPGANCGVFTGEVQTPVEIIVAERVEKSVREKDVQLIVEQVTVDCKPPA